MAGTLRFVGIHAWDFAGTPLAAVAVQTTGYNAGWDRLIEVAVVHILPGGAPQVAFDSLINPRRPIAGTEFHGIKAADVADAPAFDQIAAELVLALSGSVIVLHNAAFEMRFLKFELGQVGITIEPPHIDVVQLAAVLGHPRMSPAELRKYFSMPAFAEHSAGGDAMTTGLVGWRYLAELAGRGLRTFGDIASSRVEPKFAQSFAANPLHVAHAQHLGIVATQKSRMRAHGFHVPTRGSPLHSYSRPDYVHALLDAVADGVVTDEELASLQRIREALRLENDELRAIHAKVFAWAMAQAADDQRVDDAEAERLRALRACLARLGWAPGD